MGRRSDWIGRTNLEDLLDDGIENNSDLKTPRDSGDLEQSTDAAPNPEAQEIRRATLERIRIEEERQASIKRKHSYSLFGLLLGGVLSISGSLAALNPRETYVLHTRIRYLPSVVEHVTENGARFYGVVLFLFGLVICWYSMYRPRMNRRK